MNSALTSGLEAREAVAYGLIAILVTIVAVWLVAHRKRVKRRRARLSGSLAAKREELIRRS